MIRQYINEVYESGFKECIPLISEHHAGVDEADLTERIEEMQPNVRAIINNFAKTANANESVENLRLPSCLRVDKVDMDEDLCWT